MNQLTRILFGLLGRGDITASEMRIFLRDDCPTEPPISHATVNAILTRLVEEGLAEREIRPPVRVSRGARSCFWYWLTEDGEEEAMLRADEIKRILNVSVLRFSGSKT